MALLFNATPIRVANKILGTPMQDLTNLLGQTVSGSQGGSGTHNPITCILGPGDGTADGPNLGDNLAQTGQDAATTWKAFRWAAPVSGEAYVFSIMMVGITGDSKSADCAYAVWDDDDGSLGQLKVWGYETGHTFNANTREYFDMNIVVTNRSIVAGNIYWIGWRSTLGNDASAYFERAADRGGADEYPAAVDCTEYGCMKVGRNDASGVDFSETPFSTPNVTYLPNFYGWAVWDTTDVVVETAPTSMTHGEVVTITGSNFGTKDPAAPLIWDDCEAESKTVDSDAAVAAVWDEVHPVVGSAAVAAARTRYRNIPYRNTAAPHGHSTKYLAGCHYQYADNDPMYIGDAEDDQEYRDVLVTIAANETHPYWYAHFYYTLDPLWNTDDMDNSNHKMNVLNHGTVAWADAGNMNYDVYCGANNNPEMEADDSCRIEGHSSNNELGGCTTAPLSNNPRLAWIKWENISSPVDAKRHIYVDNVHAYQDDIINGFLDEDAQSFTVGGYYRRIIAGGDVENADFRGGVLDSNYRYFDDMYVDTTCSRVMLCTSSTYPTDDTEIVEPQIPIEWHGDGSAIKFKVNQGAIPNGTAYLFVFDSGNIANTVGFPVTLA